MRILLFVFNLLFRYLDTLPKLYHYCSSRTSVLVSELRQFEKLCTKITKLRLDIIYFEQCVNLKICPKFLCAKFPKLKAYHKTSNIKNEILKNQLGVLRHELRKICQTYSSMRTKIKDKLSFLEYAILMSRLTKKCKMETCETEQRHQRKLTKLWKEQRTPAPDCLINLSDRKLTLEEENALRLGLKHHILPRNIDSIQVKTSVEQLWSFNKKTIVSSIDTHSESTIKDKIKHATMSFLNSAKNVCGNKVNQKFHKTLLDLKKDTSIRICSYDKGNGIVIVNTTDYHQKLDQIIFDKSKFKEIHETPNRQHPVIRNENSIKNYLQKNVKGCIGKDEFEKICPSGSQPGQLYGLCKAHKQGFPFRPVVSMLNTAEYPLAKFLDEIIKPHIPSKYMLNSTTSFLQKLKNFCFSQTDILISFDVVSLFTNVPLAETIELITERVYQSEGPKPRFDKSVFKKLLEISTSGLFMYKDKLFRQTDGVSMGSPLGPTLANFCLGLYEEKLFDKSSNSPALYLRYVDDVFCVFRAGNSHEAFLDKLNQLHPNLKFTAELGPSTLAFLDTKIELPKSEDDSFSSSVYRKATYTGLLLNFSALCPTNWKIGLINCLLHRAYTICSTWKNFNEEVQYLKGLFISNGYPVDIFYQCLNRFVDRKVNSVNAKRVLEDRIEKIFAVPYIGLSSILFGRKLK